MEELDDSIWMLDTGVPGPSVAISCGVHGNERAPILAGMVLHDQLTSGAVAPTRGRLLLILANAEAARQDRRWSEGGVDLNRCFSAEVLAREPELAEERRARAVVAALERAGSEVLVDFHCTVEPGRRFLMQHPPASHAPSLEVANLLRAEVLLCDPDLNFGGVSLDEWMTTRGKVGLCYETGWMGDPDNTPDAVLEEMQNLLAGTGLVEGVEPQRFAGKRLLEMDAVLACEAEGFAWREGVGENLQELDAGTVLGAYADGRELALERPATLIFPKKRPELVQLGKPLVYLASRAG